MEDWPKISQDTVLKKLSISANGKIELIQNSIMLAVQNNLILHGSQTVTN